jgi:hypothetical protein
MLMPIMRYANGKGATEPLLRLQALVEERSVTPATASALH